MTSQHISQHISVCQCRTDAPVYITTEPMTSQHISVCQCRTDAPVYITTEPDWVGHKLGEFALTRTFRFHAGQERAGRR